MNLQRLIYLREIARRELNLTAAAQALHTSQPGVSRQILELEEELGIQIFVRKGRRLVAITEPGQRVLAIAERVLMDIGNLQQVAADYRTEDSGSLVIATTHTQARYKLPPVIRAFRERYPQVTITLRQGAPEQVAAQVRAGDADLGMASESLEHAEGVISVPCYQWTHVAVAPHDHPIALAAELTLELLAQYPLLTYDMAFTGRDAINRAFQARGLQPTVAISALDSDVVKTYVKLGMGVGLLAGIAYEPHNDSSLVARECGHLFGTRTTRIALSERRLPRSYVFSLIQQLAPDLDIQALRARLQ